LVGFAHPTSTNHDPTEGVRTMSKSNIHQLRLVVQGHQDGGNMDEGMPLSVFISGLIHQYGKYREGRMWVDSDKLTNMEKIIFLTYLVDSSDVEYATLNNARLEALYLENQNEIQSRIDDECDMLYYDMMRDRGAIPYRHRDNGEIAWRAR